MLKKFLINNLYLSNIDDDTRFDSAWVGTTSSRHTALIYATHKLHKLSLCCSDLIPKNINNIIYSIDNDNNTTVIGDEVADVLKILYKLSTLGVEVFLAQDSEDTESCRMVIKNYPLKKLLQLESSSFNKIFSLDGVGTIDPNNIYSSYLSAIDYAGNISDLNGKNSWQLLPYTPIIHCLITSTSATEDEVKMLAKSVCKIFRTKYSYDVDICTTYTQQKTPNGEVIIAEIDPERDQRSFWYETLLDGFDRIDSATSGLFSQRALITIEFC